MISAKILEIGAGIMKYVTVTSDMRQSAGICRYGKRQIGRARETAGGAATAAKRSSDDNARAMASRLAAFRSENEDVGGRQSVVHADIGDRLGLSGTAAVGVVIENAFGAVISIFAHLPSHLRRQLYPLIERALKPGGILLLEAYTLAQLPRTTGGPKDPDLLMSAAGLQQEFPHLEVVLARELDRDVAEGGHRSGGFGSVVQFIARRRD